MRTLRNVFRRKLRAFLTIFGITIGVFALVVMGGLAEKLQLLVDGGLDYYADKVIVQGKTAMGGFSTEPLSLDIIDDIEGVDGVTRVSASITAMLDEEPSTVNFGIPANIQAEDGRADGWEEFTVNAIEGRLLENGEPSEDGNVVVGSDLVTQLDAKLGETVEIRGKDYTVVGILERTLTAPDKAVLMSMNDAQQILVDDMPAAVREQIDADNLATAFAVYLEDGKDADAMAKVIGSEFPEFSTMGPAGFEKSVKEPLQIFNQIIYAVAFISLLVGGLSVINTMTMSVAERTREIGVRKAIGATDGAIMRQFIAESAIMGIIGGVLGLGLGALVVMMGNAAGAASGNELFLITPRLALGSVGFALVLGVVSGLYPAWHAARLNPVVALRYE